jgi:hypothetical protein
MLFCLNFGRKAETTLRLLEVFIVTNDKNVQWNYVMECNMAEVGGQIVECSKVKIVIRFPVKDEKNDKSDFRIFNQNRTRPGS